MSGVYIKGISMPAHCWQCPFHDDVDDCTILKKSCIVVWGEYRRRPDCPLVPIPDHGDLIDRDRFVLFIRTHWDAYDQWFVGQLEARPTIIEADKEEKE